MDIALTARGRLHEGAGEPQITSLDPDLGFRLGVVGKTPTKQGYSLPQREGSRDEDQGAVDFVPLGG